jgi:predicted PhzF superfamily epimerase YddE/YHI9
MAEQMTSGVVCADYWLRELGKDAVDAYQASKRGGYLHCEKREDGRMSVSGEAVLVATSELAVYL